jgi:hypothetical protein
MLSWSRLLSQATSSCLFIPSHQHLCTCKIDPGDEDADRDSLILAVGLSSKQTEDQSQVGFARGTGVYRDVKARGREQK